MVSADRVTRVCTSDALARARELITARTAFMLKPRKGKEERPPPCLVGRLAMKFLNEDLLPRFHAEAKLAAIRRAQCDADERKLSPAEAAELETRYVELVPPPSVSIQTARSWLRWSGFEWHPSRKGGQFTDGHNRADVVAPRMVVCPLLLRYNRRMRRFLFNAKDGKWQDNAPTLMPGERELVWVSQDESIFYSCVARARCLPSAQI